MFVMDNDMIYESENFCAPPSSSDQDTLRRAGLCSGGLRVSFPSVQTAGQLVSWSAMQTQQIVYKNNSVQKQNKKHPHLQIFSTISSW